MSDEVLKGQRILVVEDNALLAMSFGDILRHAGAEVVGPTGKLIVAELIAETEPLTAAMLDIRLDTQEVWSVARILAARGVPIVFCSGHFDRTNLPSEWANRPILVKPTRPHQIVATLAQVVAERPGSG
jgi:DNA-binding response OmpR family regulator